MTKNAAYSYSYLVSFLYVGFGTLTILSLYRDNLFYGEWVSWGMLVTFPVNFIAFGIIYADPGQQALVIVVQTIVFILVGYLLFNLLFKRYITST